MSVGGALKSLKSKYFTKCTLMYFSQAARLTREFRVQGRGGGPEGGAGGGVPGSPVTQKSCTSVWSYVNSQYFFVGGTKRCRLVTTTSQHPRVNGEVCIRHT